MHDRLFIAHVILVLLHASGLEAQSAPSTASTTADIYALRKLPEPLVPTTAEPTASDNQALLVALTAFEARTASDDFSALEQFVSANPQSPWRMALQMNLGLLYYSAGYFSKTMPAYLAAWEVGKDCTDRKAKALADRAAGEYVKMLARLGRYTDLKAFLKTVQTRPFIGQATELITAGKEGAATMETHPEKAFRCGPLALSRILASQKSALQVAPAIVDSRSTTEGISLAAVADISRQVGLNYQAAKRSPGAALIMPCVIHWKVGHYAALLKLENGRYLSEDPTFENATWHSPAALEAESSGYFLVPSGPLPAGWTEVSAEDAAKVFGKGQTSSNNPDCTKCSDTKSGGNQACCPMATYSMHAMLVSLNITDTPVGYSPPYGPNASFQVTYNQREAGQPTNFSYSNFGPKWTFNALSYITDDPAVPAVASQAVAGGGTCRITGFNSATQSFDPQYDFQSVLTRVSTSPLRYENTYPDGTKEVFALPDGSSTTPRKVFMTQRIDPAGNALTFGYDGQFRITQITDALGQVTALSYDLPSDPYKITKITDPFGRHADFTYDGSGRLIKIRDVIGIESQFTYDGEGDFIKALTTPYGTTTFTSVENGRTRRLTATDPQGDTEVLEFNEDSTLQPYSELSDTLPSGMALRNSVLFARNSYYWSKKAWKESANDYSKARLYHWLHTSDYTKANNALESEIHPLENRIWYNYPGQPLGDEGATIPGIIIKPNKIGRRLDDGSTQLVQMSYNALGNVTSMTDAAGRLTQYAYAVNNQDLLTVKQQTAGGQLTLASYTWNSQHLPLTSTDAAGQTATYTYNANGQITSVTNAKNETTAYTYYGADVAGKQRKGRLQTIDGALPGNADVTTLDYDSMGRVASVTGPDGYYLTYTYDALDRLTRISFPDGTYSETTFLALDHQTSRDRLGRMTNYVYNSIRQLVSMTDPANRTTQLTYCRCGAMKQLIDPLNRITTWKHDAAGRVTSKIYTDGATIAYAYQPLSGRFLSTTDEKGQAKTLGYNADDTLASATYTNATVATPNLAYTYDTYFPRLTSMTDGTGVTSYGYYAIAPGTLGAGQVASVDGPLSADTISYTYDALGRITGRAINGAGETRAYDELGRIVSTVSPLGTSGYSYVGATSRLSTATYPNGMLGAYSYQPLNGDFRLQGITHVLPASIPVDQFTYGYDAQGRITSWSVQDGASAAVNFSAGYDNADRLTSFTSTAHQYTYGYDAADNRQTETIDGASSTATYNALNEMLAVNSANPPPARTFGWDAENRLVVIDYTGTGLRSEFTYDGLSRCVRIVEKNGASVTADRRFVWCGYARCEERDASGATVVRRFYPEGEQIDGQSFYYSRDHLSSVRQVTDGSATIRARYDYDPYGRRNKLSGDVDSSFGFTGHFHHETSSLALAPFRAYDSNLGRWLNRDPIGFSGGINLYSYVGNSPNSSVDPFGLYDYTTFKDDSLEERYAKKLFDLPDEFSIVGHGSPRTLGKMTPEQLYNKVKDLPGFKESTKIRLWACNTGSGDNSFAEQLARISGKTVVAPKAFLNLRGSNYDFSTQIEDSGNHRFPGNPWNSFPPPQK